MHVDEAATDPEELRARGDGSARALVAAYPELRSSFEGVLVSLDATGRQALVTEHRMADIK